MESEKKSKNLGIELARIIACLCVICVHVGITNRDEQGYMTHGLLISCLVADGVAVFLIITGFFWMNNDYLKLIKKTLKKIVIPMVICYLFSFYFSDIVIGRSTQLLENFVRPWVDYKYQIKSILEFNVAVPYCGQFWYLYMYFLLVLCFPVMKSFIEYLDQSSKRIRIFLIVIGVILIWNDLTANAFLTFSHHSLNALIPASIILCLGHYIYKFKDFLVRKQFFIVYLTVFLAVNICRAYVINKYDGYETSYYILLYWFSTYGVICSSCIVLGCMCFMCNVSNKNRFSRIVKVIGENTFGIYLVHCFVIEFIKSQKGYQNIIKFCNKISLKCVEDICYLGIMSISVFIVSFLIVSCIKKVSGLIIH